MTNGMKLTVQRLELGRSAEDTRVILSDGYELDTTSLIDVLVHPIEAGCPVKATLTVILKGTRNAKADQ